MWSSSTTDVSISNPDSLDGSVVVVVATDVRPSVAVASDAVVVVVVEVVVLPTGLSTSAIAEEVIRNTLSRRDYIKISICEGIRSNSL